MRFQSRQLQSMVIKIKAVAASRWVKRDPLESSPREAPQPPEELEMCSNWMWAVVTQV